MKIIIVGASGTMGTYLSKVFEKEHEVVRADRNSLDVRVDITRINWNMAFGRLYLEQTQGR